MLNNDYKQQALSDLNHANEAYKKQFNATTNSIARLLQSRNDAARVLFRLEQYFHVLANRPRSFDFTIGQIKTNRIGFDQRIKSLEADAEQQRRKQAGYIKQAALGSGGGLLVPSAPVAVAMLMGTASTGTAISALSGVAATNAALAWLGGGALAAGGLGIAGGEVLLGVLGPVGWIAGGGTAVWSVVRTAISNKKIAEEAEEAARVIRKESARMKQIAVQADTWNRETVRLTNEIARQRLRFQQKKNYTAFSETEKKELVIMMNAAETLSKKLGETI